VIKQTTVNIAKQIAQQNLEVLKSAKQQIAPASEVIPQQAEGVEQSRSTPDNYSELEAHSKAESKRLLEALEAELAQIRKQREIREEQRKQQFDAQNQQTQSKPEFAAPVGKKSGKIKNAFGAMKKKLSDMSSRGEKQRNVSG